MNHGVKFSVFDTVNPMDGSPAVSIGIQGRDMDIMTQALINIGVESFGMDRKELEECACCIERDDQDRYPAPSSATASTGSSSAPATAATAGSGRPGRPLPRAVSRDPRPGRREQGLLRMHPQRPPRRQRRSRCHPGTRALEDRLGRSQGVLQRDEGRGGRVRGRAGMVLEAAIDRGCFISENKKKIDPKQAAAAEKNAALLSRGLGKLPGRLA